MKSKLLSLLFVCLLAIALVVTGCGGGGGSSSAGVSTTGTGNIAGSVNPTSAAQSIRAQVPTLQGLVVTLCYYDGSNNLQTVPGVESTTTDANGKYSFKNIPTSFFNLIIKVRLADGSELKGFIPVLKTNAETSIPEINQTTASLTLILEKAAEYRKTQSISGSCQINMGDIMSLISPSELVKLGSVDLGKIAETFVKRERTIIDNMDSTDLSAYQTAAFGKARDFCETMAKNGSQSLIGMDEPWKEFGKQLRTEFKNFAPEAILVFQQADGLVASLPVLIPALPQTVKDGISTGVEQNRFVNNMHAILHAIRILSEGLTYDTTSIPTIETGIETLTTTMESASANSGVGQAFTGNFAPDMIFAQVQSLFDALGLTSTIIQQIVPTPPAGILTPEQFAEARGQAMKQARLNLDTVLAGNAALAARINTEDKKNALIFLFFGPGDIGIPMPKPGTAGQLPTPVERPFFGLLINATSSYTLGDKTYQYVIVPPPGFPPPPAEWGCLVFVRAGTGMTLNPSTTQPIEAVVSIEQAGQPGHAPAGAVISIRNAAIGTFTATVTAPEAVQMQGKVAKNEAGVICFFPGGLTDWFMIVGATQADLAAYLDKWISVKAVLVQQEGTKPAFKFDMSSIKLITQPASGGMTPTTTGNTQMFFGAIKTLSPSQTIDGNTYTHEIYDPMATTLNNQNQIYIRAGTGVTLTDSNGARMNSQVQIVAVYTDARPALGVVVATPTFTPAGGSDPLTPSATQIKIRGLLIGDGFTLGHAETYTNANWVPVQAANGIAIDAPAGIRLQIQALRAGSLDAIGVEMTGTLSAVATFIPTAVRAIPVAMGPTGWVFGN